MVYAGERTGSKYSEIVNEIMIPMPRRKSNRLPFERHKLGCIGMVSLD